MGGAAFGRTKNGPGGAESSAVVKGVEGSRSGRAEMDATVHHRIHHRIHLVGPGVYPTKKCADHTHGKVVKIRGLACPTGGVGEEYDFPRAM